MGKYSDTIDQAFRQPQSGNRFSITKPSLPEDDGGRDRAGSRDQEEGVGLGDYGSAFGMGAGQLVSGAGWLFGSDEMQELGQETTDYWERQLSEPMRESMSKRFVTEDFGVGEAVTDPNSWGGVLMQSLPSMVPGIGAAGAVTKGSKLLGAGQKLASGLGATAGSTAEGAVIGGMVGEETENAVMEAPEEELQESPYYQDLLKTNDPETARRKVAEKAGEAAALPASVGGAILGTAFNKFVGDAVTGRLSKRITREGLKGAALEGATETAQEGLEATSSQYALSEYAGQEMSGADILNQMAAGGGAGGLTGGLIGVAGGMAGDREPDPAEKAQAAQDEVYEQGGDPLQAANASAAAFRDSIAEGNFSPDTPLGDIDSAIADSGDAEAFDLGGQTQPASFPRSEADRQNAPMFPERERETLAQQYANRAPQDEDAPILYQQDGVTVRQRDGDQPFEASTDDGQFSVRGTSTFDARRKLNQQIQRNQKQDPILQNRDRSRPDYVAQMQDISENPDYDRVSVSREPNSGAPMVFERGQQDSIPEEDRGRTETITMDDGQGGTRKIQAQYAVVEADHVAASNQADGTQNEAYGRKGLTALNNGRTAGLQSAFQKGNAGQYVDAFKNDEGHGISREAIESKRNPMLVRRFDESALEGIEDPGAASNVSTSAELSAAEQANTDARKLDIDTLAQAQPGPIDGPANRDFVRSFIDTVGGAGKNNRLIDSEGLLTQDGMKRIQGALVARAFADDTLTQELTEATDSDLRTLGDALADVAGRWALMRERASEGSINPDMDITEALRASVNMIRKSRQQGQALSDIAGQVDAFSGETDQMAKDILSLFYRGKNYTSIRGRETITNTLNGFLDGALESAPEPDMFGQMTTPEQVLEAQNGERQQQEQPASSGVQPDGREAETDGQAGEGSVSGAGRREDAEAGQEDEQQSGVTKDPDPQDEIATAASEAEESPTEAQKEAGNYRKGHIRFQGLDITIENPRGSTRSGTDPDGNRWESEMAHHYGYIKRSEGADGDHVDVFVGPDTESDQVFVIDQQDGDGSFDEHKVMLGFQNQKAAEQGYLDNYEEGWTIGPVTRMGMDEFRQWLDSGDTTAPLADPPAPPEPQQQEPQTPSPEGVSRSGQEESGETDQPQDAETDQTEPQQPTQPIEDFGETIAGARKEIMAEYRAKMEQAKELDPSEVPLSKSWPEPNYQKMLDDGADPEVVAAIHALRDEIPTKPQKKWKLRGWAESVTRLRGIAERMLESASLADRMLTGLKEESKFEPTVNKIAMYEQLGHDTSLKGLRLRHEHYSRFRGEEDVSKWVVSRTAKSNAFGNMPVFMGVGDTRKEAIADFRQRLQEQGESAPREKAVRFDIYSDRQTGDIFIGKKIGSDLVRMRSGFDSANEARDYLRDNQQALEDQLARMKDIPDHRKESNAPRVGADHRNGGDVTPEAFQEAFGFRGVQFGNAVSQSRRQEDLNNAYDALMDMAGVLNIPARALSLNGKLGLAFGARGKGGKRPAKAHYEPSQVVINLTKRDGAGSLAHEWWHALDNYFSRQKTDGFATEGVVGADVRPEMREAFETVMRTVNRTGLRERSRALDKVRTKQYWSTGREMTARSFESYIIEKLKDQNGSNDYLANIVSEEYWSAAEELGIKDGGTYPYPEAAEIEQVRGAFDELFNTIDTKETDQGTALFSRSGVAQSIQGVRQSWNARGIDNAIREKNGVITVDKMVVPEDSRGEGVGTEAMNELIRYADETGQAIALSPSEDFGGNRIRLGRFYRRLGFVPNKGANKDFTVSEAMIRQPQGEAFRRGAAVQGRPLTADEARAIADELMQGWAGRPQVIVADTISEFPADLKAAIRNAGAEGDMRAVFWNDQIYVLAPRIPNRRAMEEVILHEVVGHYGLRKMLGNDLKPTLNRIYLSFANTDKAQEIRDIYFPDGDFDSANASHRMIVAEELLAHMAETGRRPTLLQQAIAKIREGLRRLGFALDINESELLNLLRGARRTVENGGFSRPSSADTNFRRAYHGTPHRFDRFSLEAMGTGEGAQAYGWGLYFAGNRQVAEFYRKNLTLDYAGQNLDARGLVERVAEDMEGSNKGEKVKDVLQRRRDNVEDPDFKARMQAGIDLIDSGFEPGGTLYEVEIPDDNDLLDWDKSISEQPEQVREGIEAAANELAENDPAGGRIPQGIIDDDGTGGAFVEALAAGMGRADENQAKREASELLGRHNIPGLRYLDANSRNTDWEVTPPSRTVSGKWMVKDASKPNSRGLFFETEAEAQAALEEKQGDSHNYVVWDEDVVSIQAVNDEKAQAEAMFSRAGRSGSDRTPWPSDFPRVPFATTLGQADAHPRYEEAKAGDVEAARDLVEDLVPDEAMDKVREMVGDGNPVVVPVNAEESTGTNRIPAAYAAKIAQELGLDVEPGIVQSVRAQRTNARADHRLANHAVFDGEVEAGRDYLIVDDTMTMGGTLASLRGHIEANGGNVIGATALTGYGDSGQLALTEKMRDDLWDKHGAPLDNYLREEFGYGIESLTQGEAGHFRKAVSLDAIRDRITAARLDQGDGSADEAGSPRQPPEVDDDSGDGEPRFSRAGNRLDHASEHFNDLSDSQRSALNKIAPRTPKEKASQWITERMDRWQTKVRQGAIDRFAALKDVDEALYGRDVIESSTASSSWVLAQMSGAASGALKTMLTNARVRLDPEQKVIKPIENTKGLSETLRQLGSSAEIERFFGWIAGNRSEKLMAEGRENLFEPDEVRALMELNQGQTENGESRQMLYAKVFREFQKYRDDVLDIAEKSGIITSEQRQTWADEFYVPFYRLADGEGGFTGPKSSGGISRQEAYKKLKGGSENLNDLLENTMMNFHHLMQASLKNQAAIQAIDNATELEIAQQVAESERDTENSTFILRNGEKVWYQIDDPLVFKAVSALAHPGMNSSAMKIMRGFKRLFTNLTTTTPQFVIANLMRDAMQASATSEVSKNFLANIARGSKAYGNPETRARMMASGGSFSFGHLYGENADELKMQLSGTLSDTEILRTPSMVPTAMRSMWRKWNEMTEFTENVNRAAIFEANREERGDLYAAFKARDLMNFSQHGAWPAMRVLIDVVPFLNARLQGLDKIYRSGVKPGLMMAMKKGTETDAMAAKRFWSVAGTMALASIALYLANEDDEEFQKLEEWQKDTYWFFRVSENHAIFIPKPFEVGAIATLAERLTEQAVSDTATGDLFKERLTHMLTDTFAFSPVPQIAQPTLDVYANYDAFTGRPIESMGMDRLSPALRRRSSTTRVAEWISSASQAALGPDSMATLSPVQVDHLIQGYFGQVGSWAAGITDTVIRTAQGETAPASRWYENQPIRRFYQNLGDEDRYTRYGSVFYDALRETNRVYSDIKEYQDLGQTEAALELFQENRQKLAYRKELNRVQRKLSKINKRIEQVRRMNRSSEYKRRELDRLRGIKNRIQEMVGRRLEEISAGS